MSVWHCMEMPHDNLEFPLRHLASLAIVGLLAACSGDSDDEVNANGIAVASWVAPTLNDDGSALTDLAGFRVHYGTTPASLTRQLEVADPAATTGTITGLASGTWYFGVTAYSTLGVESAMSGLATKSIP